MSASTVTVSPDWLRLREPADAAARSLGLRWTLGRVLADTPRHVVHDLGSGTGSMGRWLAPRLPGRQHWVLHDRDAALLAVAAAHPPTAALDGAAVSVETRTGDLTRLGADDVADATLITASALLDMLTLEEMERVVARCVQARCPVLLTLSVTGRVRLTPGALLDARIETAFNDHQRRRAGERALLGPDAAAAARDLARGRGARVLVAASPWRLGADAAALAAEWLTGWLAAAVEQRPDLLDPVAGYAGLRRAQLAGGGLGVLVDHVDLLVLPPR